MPTSFPARFKHSATPARGAAAHGSTRQRRSAESGFTLIELMIVMTIMALATTAVIMTLPDDRSRIREDAERFALRVAGARDQAVLASRPIAVLVSPSGYSLSRRQQGQWRPLEDRPFVTTSWRGGISATSGARFVFDGTGATEDEGTVTLVREGAQVPILVRADGKVSVGG
ncbi:MAG TPA: GspH/FimT family pseudopilin [Sphingomicrobium sp.]